MTAAERFVSRLLTGSGDNNSKALSPKDEGAKGFIDEDGNNWAEFAIETAIEYLEKEGEEPQRNPFSKGWGRKKGRREDTERVEKTAQEALYEALVEDELPKDESLQEHDKRHHPDGFNPDTDTCKFREKLAKSDEADEVDIEKGEGRQRGKKQEAGKRPLVTAEEDAEYMKAVEIGDMDRAAKMVREAASRAMPDTKILDEDGLPMIVYHGTQWDGRGAFYEGRTFFTTRGLAEEFIEGDDEARVLPLFADMKNPYFAGDGMLKEDGTPYKARKGRDEATADDITWGEDIESDLKRRGYDGIVDNMFVEAVTDDSIFNSIFDPSNLKSAATVSYYDDGSIVPLSKRFGGGTDIRFAIGKDEPFPYETDQKKEEQKPHQKTYGEIPKKKVAEYQRLMEKKHPELDADMILEEIGKIKDRKLQGDAFAWVMRGTVRLPEDMYKVEQARELATKAKKDPLSWDTPQACINELMGKGHRVSEKPITVEELKKNPLMSDYRDEGYGVETFEVDDSKEGQALMRKVIDTHWGKDANPWCLLARGGKADETTPEFWDWVQSHFDNVSDAATDFQKNNLEWQGRYEQETGKSPILESHQLDNAWGFWNKYNALQKRVAFKDGKLLAFMATDGSEFSPEAEAHREEYENSDDYRKYDMSFDVWMMNNYPYVEIIGEQWWDRQDRPHNGIPLGETEVPNDKLGRKVDMSELINGEITIPKGMKKYIGREGEKGYKAWDDDGRFYEDVGFGKTIREDEIPKREIKRLLGNFWLATLHRGGNFSNGRINAMLDDKLDLVGLMDGDGRPIPEGTDDYSKYVDEVADLVSSYRGEDNKKDKTNDIIVLPNGTKIKKSHSYLYTDSKGELHDEKWSVAREKKLGDGRISKEFSDVLDTLLSGKDVSDEEIMSLPEWKEAMQKEKDIDGRLQKEYGVTRTKDINTKARNRFRDAIVEAALSDHITKTVPIEGYDGEVFETNEGLEEGESYDVEKGKKVFIAIGLPAAGKSTTFANPLAKKYKARLCDSDTVKKVLPEFANGYGGNLVHDESTDINERILAGAVEKGDNIVYPILGYKPENLQSLMKMFKDKGYEVNLCFKDMPANIAKGRLLGRFLQKGRYLPLTCISKAQGKVGDSFEAVKGYADAYIRATSDPDGSNEKIIDSKGKIL